jgi:hypothetical protein
LEDYIQGTLLGNVLHHRTNAHPHDIYTVQKTGTLETDSTAPRALTAELDVQPVSGAVMVGFQTKVVVTITNTGDTTWLNTTPDGRGEVHLGANLFDPNHNLLKEDYGRVLLPRIVRSGETLQLQFALPAIQKPGEYVVEYDMVDDGFMWFKDYAYQPVRWTLKVMADSQAIEPSAWLVLPNASPRIIPRELPFQPNPIKTVLRAESRLASLPIGIILRRGLEILRLYGPVVFARTAVSYFRRRIFIR